MPHWSLPCNPLGPRHYGFGYVSRSRSQSAMAPTNSGYSGSSNSGSCYRRYMQKFSDIAAPLNALTQKCVPFVWTQECTEAFTRLNEHLVRAPVLAYLTFHPNSKEFVLQTDASAVDLGAVLEQDGHAIAYASRSLTQAERQYSVIQRKCLAIVYALKRFRHYLLGRHFRLFTDRAPLQWLSAQKMEGILCRWALAMQE